MINTVQYAPIKVPSEDYDAELALRETLLREPLGLALSPNDTQEDMHQIHIGAFYNGALIGCVLVAPEQDPEVFRIRQMAVHMDFQGRSIGRQLIQQAEQIIQQQQGKRIVLNARASALGFYRRLNYQTASAEFTSNTIAHVVMEKHLID